MAETMTISRPAIVMPDEVLASTCDSLPQWLHSTGLARLDQRLAMLSIPGWRQ